MMEGENVKARATTFNLPQPKAARSPRFFIGGLCCRFKSFDEFIRHQVQALSFGYIFIKKKVKAIRRPAEARLCSGKRKNYLKH